MHSHRSASVYRVHDRETKEANRNVTSSATSCTSTSQTFDASLVNLVDNAEDILWIAVLQRTNGSTRPYMCGDHSNAVARVISINRQNKVLTLKSKTKFIP